MGNLRSVSKALELVGARTVVTGSPRALRSVTPRIPARVLRPIDKIYQEKRHLRRHPMHHRRRKTLSRVMLGFQMLLTQAARAEVIKDWAFSRKSRKVQNNQIVPHMDGTAYDISPEYREIRCSGIANDSYFYFVHSYSEFPKTRMLSQDRPNTARSSVPQL